MKQFASGHAMQSAWVVDDLDAAVDAWLKVGIGPFFFVEYTPDLFEDSTYRGTPSPISMKIALAQAGDMQIELIEPTGEQANIYRDTVPEGKQRSITCVTGPTTLRARSRVWRLKATSWQQPAR